MKRKRVKHLQPRIQGQLRVAKPWNMEEVEMDHKTRQLFEEQALGIFTDCANAGLPFRDSLVAILVTGMDWGVNLKSERT